MKVGVLFVTRTKKGEFTMAKPMTTKDKVREWISDNLRYMLLILGILAVVGMILLIVSLVSSHSNGKKNAGGAAASVSVTSVESTGPQTAETSTDSGSSSGKESENTASALAESGQDTEKYVPDDSAVVKQTISAYFTAMAAKDIDGLLNVTDQLSEEEKQQIEAEQDVERYENIETYTVKGRKENTYLSLVRYDCIYRGIEEPLPMLTELYLYQNAEGKLIIMDDTAADPEVSGLMDDFLEEEAAKEQIQQVQKEYEDALAKDSALKAYVESIQ